MKKLFIFLIVLSLFPLVSALDQQLPQDICGGDSEFLIDCFSDEQLIFLAGLTPSNIGGLNPGIEPLPTLPTPDKEESPKSESETSRGFSIFPWLGLGEGEIILDVALVFFLVLISILVYQARKRRKLNKNPNLNSSII